MSESTLDSAAPIRGCGPQFGFASTERCGWLRYAHHSAQIRGRGYG